MLTSYTLNKHIYLAFYDLSLRLLPPKLGHILKCLAFSEFSFCQKRDHTLPKSLFETTLENKKFKPTILFKTFFSFFLK